MIGNFIVLMVLSVELENSQTQLMVEMRIRKGRSRFFACEMDKRKDASSQMLCWC